MTSDILTKLTQTNPHAVRAWVVKIISVSTAAGTCTIDPNDGDVVTEVPYWGPAPGVGSVQVALLFDGLLGVVSTGGATSLVSVATTNGVGGTGTSADPVKALTSNTWGLNWLAKSGNDPTAGRGIYIDAQGALRSRPLELDATQNTLTGSSAPGAWPVGMINIQVTAATAATWPGSVSGMVITYRRAGEDDTTAVVHQWFYTTSVSVYSIKYRAAAGNPTGWGPWAEVLFYGGGWKAIPLSGWRAVGSFTPQYRLETNGVVRLRGTLTKTAGGNLVSGESWATLPAEAAPKQNQFVAAMTSGFAAVRVDITTAGVCTLNAHSAVAASLGTNLAIDSISYDGGNGP
jgi:hypothetical protein